LSKPEVSGGARILKRRGAYIILKLGGLYGGTYGHTHSESLDRFRNCGAIWDCGAILKQ